MSPIKDDEQPAGSTSAQIQQIFSELQSQLPSVNFDDDEQTDDGDTDEVIEPAIVEDTDGLLASLSNRADHSFLAIQPRMETSQQPPSVELQMRASPNLFDNALPPHSSPPKSSLLSMDLFNSIDFDRLSSIVPQSDASPPSNRIPSFNRPRPSAPRHTNATHQTRLPGVKARDDRQILERLAHQVNQFHGQERTPLPREHHPMDTLESILYANAHAHDSRTGVPETRRKTIFIDLRHSQVKEQDPVTIEQPFIRNLHPVPPQSQSSDSDSGDDDDRNDGMLWFEQRQQAKRQQQRPN